MALTVCTGGTILVHPNAESAPEVLEGPRIAHAIAFKEGKVIAHDDEALTLAGEADEFIDLAGATLAPALGDGHAHPVLGGLEAAGPAIRSAQNLEEILAAVAEWKAANPEAEWIVGGSYDATFAPGGRFDARWLDEVTGGTPTILRSWDYHTAWVNSAALRVAGITAETPDPPLGRIVRREDGSPLGTLQESAANNFLAEIVPAVSREHRVEVLDKVTADYAAQGMTWVQDAWVDPADVEAYVEAARVGRLHTRVNLALRADPQTWREQVADFVATRAEIRELQAQLHGDRPDESRLSAETIKFFLDGVIESHTAALLEPYADQPDELGLPNWQPDELQAATRAFHDAGFQLHLHAIGDRANRMALDALEAISAVTPISDRAHVIAHVAMLAPGDAERFAALGVIANFEPYWAQCDPVMRDLTIPHIGHDREGWQYLIGSVLRSGATVSFGSDWPVTTVDWRPALSTAITRHSHLEPNAEPWLPEERVTAGEALAAYTTGIAAQSLAEDRGTLEVGNVADAVWLSANPLTADPSKIPDIEVLGTWLAGKRTF